VNLVLVLGTLFLYIGVRLLAPLPLPAQVAGAAALLACWVVMPKGFGRGSRFGAMLPWVTAGLFSSLLVLTASRDVLLIPVAIWADDYRAWVRMSAVFVLGLAPLVTALSFFLARRTAPVVTVEIPVADLAPGLHGFTIAQISDLHVGPTIRREYVERVVARVNGMGADMVAITGDIVDGSVAELTSHTEPLGDLTSRHGTYVVTGNHEYYSGAHSWIVELRRLGARVLMNEHVVLEHEGAHIAIAGVTDYGAHYFDQSHRSDPRGAVAGAPQGVMKILLAHQPRSGARAAEAGYHLQLSGHTHGGQFWPWNFFVRLQQPFTAGLERIGQMWIYISRGTGYWGPPQRFGAPSEITRIRLVKA